MPLTLGITRTQSLVGSEGSGTSPSLSIESALVATSGRPPAALTTAKAGIEREYWSASTLSRPSPRPSPLEGRGGALSPSYFPQVFMAAWSRHRQTPVSPRHPAAFDRA